MSVLASRAEMVRLVHVLHARQAHQRWNAYAERIPLVKDGD